MIYGCCEDAEDGLSSKMRANSHKPCGPARVLKLPVSAISKVVGASEHMEFWLQLAARNKADDFKKLFHG